jgi:hypothetical protein
MIIISGWQSFFEHFQHLGVILFEKIESGHLGSLEFQGFINIRGGCKRWIFRQYFLGSVEISGHFDCAPHGKCG